MEDVRIVFLHHSTGQAIWDGDRSTVLSRLLGSISVNLSRKFYKPAFVPSHFKLYNRINHKKFIINDLIFPKAEPYGWSNYPYDYYNIWVKHAGVKEYLGEPTLEILTKRYDVIIFKHCFPVSSIKEEIGNPNIDSDEKRIENYKLQYLALKNKMHEFPYNKFIIWTPAVYKKSQISEKEAIRTNTFYKWMINEWDEKGDNVYIWDFYQYETGGGIYLLDEYARGISDSHPNTELSVKAAEGLCQFIIDVVEHRN